MLGLQVLLKGLSDRGLKAVTVSQLDSLAQSKDLVVEKRQLLQDRREQRAKEKAEKRSQAREEKAERLQQRQEAKREKRMERLEAKKEKREQKQKAKSEKYRDDPAKL